jgi:hypothetical protein
MNASKEEVLREIIIELQKIIDACQKQLTLFEETERQGIDKIGSETRVTQEAAKKIIDKQIEDLRARLHSEHDKNNITKEDLFAGLESLLVREPIYQFYKLASKQTFGIVEQPEKLPIDFINDSELDDLAGEANG